MGDRDDDVADWLKGRPLTAEQALRRRLLQNVVPSDELAAVLPGAITHEDPRHAFAMIKPLLRAALDTTWPRSCRSGT
jgi:enoyl-CoA hydratase/carnithine racemase